MNVIYNAAISLANALLPLTAGSGRNLKESKFRKFANGQKGIIRHIRETFDTNDGRPVLWIHAASLGEYGVARPLIRKIQSEGKYRTVQTFFSPSGYEAMKGRKNGPDQVFYLPLDTRHNVRDFLDIIRPAKAVFIISELWPNYLEELRKRNIPTYLISAVVTRNSSVFKWYGRTFRKCLKTFRAITVLNEESKKNLESVGYHQAIVTGDPLFDNVTAAAATGFSDPVIERFVLSAQGRVFMAGSTSDIKDTELVTGVANRNRDIKFLIVPHEITEESIREITSCLQGKALLYSQSAPSQDMHDTQTLIIDTVGMLAYLYRYARWAYVGGGFTPLLHNILEATVYGIPVSFGPMTERKTVPDELVRLGLGQKVRTVEELDRWLLGLKDNEDRLDRIRHDAQAYMDSKSGATDTIINILKTY